MSRLIVTLKTKRFTLKLYILKTTELRMTRFKKKQVHDKLLEAIAIYF